MRRLVAVSVAVLSHALPAAGQVTGPPDRITVTVAGQPIAVWCRAATHPTRTILFVHGATWSARPDFDLQVPGEQRSILAGFAAHGFAACALDLPGYGATPRDRSGWLTPSQAAEDVAGVLSSVMAQHPGLPPPVLVGWSNGALVAQLAAQRAPDRLSALVLFGDPWDPSFHYDDGPIDGPAPHVRNTAADARADFITPGVISAQAIAAYVATALRTDPVRAEWRAFDEWNGLDARAVRVPTLLLHGEFDPGTPDDAQQRILAGLGANRARLVVLRHGDHAALLEDTQPGFVEAILDFLDARH